MDDRFRREAVPTTTCPITTARTSSTPTFVSCTLICVILSLVSTTLDGELGSPPCRWVSS